MMVGYKSLKYQYNSYKRVLYMRVTDTNLNVIFEKNIDLGDTTEFYISIHSIINKSGNLVMWSYVDSYTDTIYHKSKVYFYELDFAGNILKHKYIDTSNAGIVSLAYCIAERKDSLGYLVINEATTNSFLHLDTNSNIIRIAIVYYNYNLMKGLGTFGLSYLLPIHDNFY